MPSRATGRFSPVALAFALLTVGGGAGAGLLANTSVGTFLGILVGGFLLGLALTRRPLVEATVAAVAAKLVVLAAAGVPGVGVLGAVAALGSIGPASLAASLALAAAAGGFGAHLGSDLRDGLTTPLEEQGSSGPSIKTGDPTNETITGRNQATPDDGTPEDDRTTASESGAESELEREPVR